MLILPYVQAYSSVTFLSSEKLREWEEMCENIHAVPVSSYFMFVILVLLTLGLIHYGEPQLSLVRALAGFLGAVGLFGVKGMQHSLWDVHVPGDRR